MSLVDHNEKLENSKEETYINANYIDVTQNRETNHLRFRGIESGLDGKKSVHCDAGAEKGYIRSFLANGLHKQRELDFHALPRERKRKSNSALEALNLFSSCLFWLVFKF